ncbi:MAG: glycosyltransferase family 2 protein [Patescibacteria group bacterium]|nr:glycosyltransferase family 2 protein [Patescibacteria group bacterium]
MSRPKVAIIILLYNSLEYLQDCFSSLQKLNYPKDGLEIIVIDNNSSDESAEFIKKNYPNITLIENRQNLGYCAGNNVGIKYALEKKYDYVFILNPDTMVDENCLNNLITTMENNERIGIVQPKILLWPDKDKIQTSGNKIHYLGLAYSGDCFQPDNLSNEIKDITYASGAAMLVKKEVFERVGLLPEYYFMYHDDLELGWQTWMMGYEIKLVPSGVVYHKYSFSENKKKFFWMERARFWFLLKNFKIGTLILILPALLMMEIGIVLFSLKSSWFTWKIKSYFSFLSKLPKTLKARCAIQNKRVLKDRDLKHLLTGVIKFEGFDSPVIKLANIFFNLYWQIIKLFIFW